MESSTVTMTSTATPLPTPVCPSVADASFAGSGSLALQLYQDVGVLRFDPATAQFYALGSGIYGYVNSLAVLPDDPSKLVIDNNYAGVISGSQNIRTMALDGTVSSWGYSSDYASNQGAFDPITKDYWVTTGAAVLLHYSYSRLWLAAAGGRRYLFRGDRSHACHHFRPLREPLLLERDFPHEAGCGDPGVRGHQHGSHAKV